MSSGYYSIRDLEKLTDIKAHTIRIWEKRYGIINPKRTCTNIRTYCDEDLKRLLNIAILKNNGLKISQIALLSEAELNEKVINLTNKITDTESRIGTLILAMIEFDEIRLDKIFSTLVINYGFEDTIIDIIIPLFEKIGILWQTGSIDSVHEHFFSNFIRQKLIIAIDGCISKENITNPKKFLLFLPESEIHELALLIYSYIIKKRGHKVIYLGRSVPVNKLKNITSVIDFDYMLVSSIYNIPMNKYIYSLSEMFHDIKIFISGYYIRNNEDITPSNIKILKSFRDFSNETFLQLN
ncbi:MAG: MerR family transcriptional regulator [Bacteroidales bacterium]|nr:MerR family transcriptional regulator [Bacteroidales bacterium]